jgi:hypothetical protein
MIWEKKLRGNKKVTFNKKNKIRNQNTFLIH